MAGKDKTPEIRFIGFTDAWEQRKLGDLMGISSASRVHKNEWEDAGVPFFRSSDVVAEFKGTDNGKAFISYTLYEELAKKSGRVQKDDILVTGGGSIGIPYLVRNNAPLYFKDADLIWLKNAGCVNGQFLYTFFSTAGFRHYVNSITHIGTISHYTIEQAQCTPICLPDRDEQNKIGQFSQRLDNLITLHQRKFDKLVIIKKSMLDKMFPKDGANVPEIRFAGFIDAWKQRKLGEIADRVHGNDGRMDLPTLTISAANGWLDQRDRFYGNIAGNEQKNYTLLSKGELSYNHGNSKLAKYGMVFELRNHQEALVPRVYHSFRVKEDTDSSFVECLFSTKLPDKELGKLISSGARMDGLLNISYDDFMGIAVNIPQKAEQANIGAFFRKFDSLITLHHRKLEKLKNIKKALLEKMFV